MHFPLMMKKFSYAFCFIVLCGILCCIIDTAMMVVCMCRDMVYLRDGQIDKIETKQHVFFNPGKESMFALTYRSLALDACITIYEDEEMVVWAGGRYQFSEPYFNLFVVPEFIEHCSVKEYNEKNLKALGFKALYKAPYAKKAQLFWKTISPWGIFSSAPKMLNKKLTFQIIGRECTGIPRTQSHY